MSDNTSVFYKHCIHNVCYEIIKREFSKITKKKQNIYNLYNKVKWVKKIFQFECILIGNNDV